MHRQEQQRPGQEASASEASEALTGKTQEESHLGCESGDAYDSVRESRDGCGCAVKKGDFAITTVPGLFGALISVFRLASGATFFLGFASKSFGGFCTTALAVASWPRALLLLAMVCALVAYYRKTSNIINLSNR